MLGVRVRVRRWSGSDQHGWRMYRMKMIRCAAQYIIISLVQMVCCKFVLRRIAMIHGCLVASIQVHYQFTKNPLPLHRHPQTQPSSRM
jgi:hypothetical protein